MAMAEQKEKMARLSGGSYSVTVGGEGSAVIAGILAQDGPCSVGHLTKAGPSTAPTRKPRPATPE